MKISFDFDGVLSTCETVRDYAKKLIAQDIDVWICTARYFDGNKNALWGNASNDDVYNIAKELGIPFSNIIFTNMEDKSSYLEKLQPVWHLDDDDYICGEIIENSSIPCIDVKHRSWRYYCDLLIKIHNHE